MVSNFSMSARAAGSSAPGPISTSMDWVTHLPYPIVDESDQLLRESGPGRGWEHDHAPDRRPDRAGRTAVFSEPILVVNQKAKLIEINNEYAIFDQHGTQIGAVRQTGQSAAKKVLRALTSLDQFLTHRLQVVDMSGRVLLALTRPAKLMKSRVVVEDGDGRPVGEIVQENMIGKIHFGLHAGGVRVGAIQAENWRAWNFAITDAAGAEVARITKTCEGVAKTLFTTADNYVVHIPSPLAEPLRSLVVAAAVSVDTALKQDSRGLG
ncbi:MAG: LURP-one-related/scramblase family protein [Acidimicrobiales bacterium]